MLKTVESTIPLHAIDLKLFILKICNILSGVLQNNGISKSLYSRADIPFSFNPSILFSGF